MADSISQLWQTIAEALLQAPSQEPIQIATAVCNAILANAELSAALKTDSRMMQINQGNAMGYQVLVEGGVAYIGTHYQVDGGTLKPLLDIVLRKIFQKPVGIPNNLPSGGALNFVGRNHELATLHDQLQQNDRLAISSIHGMGGVGKTELALQYGLKYLQLESYTGGVCWLRSGVNVGIQIVEFARRQLSLEPPEELELVGQVGYCWRHWRDGEVLTIFDDVQAQDYKDIQPYFPPVESRFKMLLTTRSRLGASVRELELQVLEKDAALEMLRALVGRDRIQAQVAEAEVLCEWLGYLPLGLELVGRYLTRKKDLSLAEMWKRLEKKRLEQVALQKTEWGMTAQRGVAAAFDLSWQELEQQARQLAGLLGLFAAAPISWQLVQDCLPEWDEETLENVRDMQFLDLNLVRYVEEGTYQLHPLIREFFRSKLNFIEGIDDLGKAFTSQMLVLAERISQKHTLNESLSIKTAIPHLEQVVTECISYLNDKNLLEVFERIGWFYEGQNIYKSAEYWYKSCCQTVEKRLTKSHPDYAMSLNNLAEFYRSQGDYIQSEPLHQLSLNIAREALSPNHPDLAIHLNNLGLLYKQKGEYGKAELLYQEALEIDRESIPQNQRNLCIRLNNLALLNCDLKRFDEAETQLLESLEISRQLFSSPHPSIALRLSNLAKVYTEKNQYGQAEQLYKEALEMSEETLSRKHPQIAGHLYCLSELYRQQGRYEESEELILEALSIDKDLNYLEHPDHAKHISSLALLYDIQERYFEAEPLYQKALEIFEKRLPSSHPLSIKIQERLMRIQAIMAVSQ